MSGNGIILQEIAIDNQGRPYAVLELSCGYWTINNDEWEYVGCPDEIWGCQTYKILSDKNGDLWFGTQCGIAKLNNGNWIEAWVIPDFNMSIGDIAFDSEENIWIAGKDGLIKFKDGVYNDYGTGGYDILWANSVAVDKNDVVWIGDEGGLFYFDGTNWGGWDWHGQ